MYTCPHYAALLPLPLAGEGWGEGEPKMECWVVVNR